MTILKALGYECCLSSPNMSEISCTAPAEIAKKEAMTLESIFLYMPVLNTSQYHTFQPMSVSDWEGYTEPRKFLNLGSLSWKAWKMNPQGAFTIPNYP